MAVRSRRLFGPEVNISAGATVSYTVPSGRTAVVRLLVASIVGTVANQLRVRLGLSGPEIFRVDLTPGVPFVMYDLVFNPGDVIRFSANTTGGSNIDVSLFGSLLDGEPE